jgi:hypothetical protein
MKNSELSSYMALPSGEKEEVTYFFLEKILRARVSMHLETGGRSHDEAVNMYLAGLLRSVVCSGGVVCEKPYLSPFDFEVRHYLDDHPGTPTEFVVYKDNADFGLVAVGVFLGFRHPGSYHGRMMAKSDPVARIALYYHLAASALEHIRRTTLGLSEALNAMADHIAEIIRIIRTVAGDYFDLADHLSAGSLFHLEREAYLAGVEKSFKEEMDLFLKHYAEYRQAPTIENKQQVLHRVAALRKLDPDFRFDEAQL